MLSVGEGGFSGMVSGPIHAGDIVSHIGQLSSGGCGTLQFPWPLYKGCHLVEVLTASIKLDQAASAVPVGRIL